MTSPFQPLPCPGGGGGGEAGADVEQLLLCDVMPDGQIAGTALAVYEYDADGNPVGAPTFVNPTTGAPYVAQGALMPCPGEVGCSPPSQFCFTSTTTGPVDHPGRAYDITLPINPGFAVDSLQIDATSYPAGLTWAVTDADGEQFRTALQAFLAARFPGQTVTVNNPNAGTPVCGLAQAMTVHIECVRLDAPAPNLVELVYNGGRDLVVNPAYLTTPPTNLNGPQFVYLQRQDAGGTLNCTNAANQGWETNDGAPGGADFELWGQGPGGLQTTEAATPTPRGTPIQEITADFPAGPNPPTIWQTFTVPAAGTLKAVLVHGARDNGEQHRITLSTGDTNDNQVGDIINNVTNPPQVTNAGGGSPGPWTTFSQDVALGAGVYTFAISTTNPVGPNRGGLFTDMRVYVDAPDQRATAVNDDDTCVVTVEETVTTTTCEYWQPRCSNGEITAWVNVADGQELSNAAFWGQAPAPQCCLPAAGGDGSDTVTAGNLVHSYDVCAVVGGVRQTLTRVVYTDQSGGVVGASFVGPDGGPVVPTSWVPGACTTGFYLADQVLCDDNGPFLRKFVQTLSDTNIAQINSVRDFTLAGAPYTAVGTVVVCSGDPCRSIMLGAVCVTSTDLPGIVLRAVAVQSCEDGTVIYVNPATGLPFPGTVTVVICPPDNTFWEEILCDAGAGGAPFRRVYTLSALGSAVTFDEDLAGDPYVPVGPVASCTGECRNSSAVLLCDAPADDITVVTPAIADGTVADVGQGQFTNLAGPYTSLWSGGTLAYPATAGPGQQYPMAVGRLTAAPAGCDDAAGNLTVSVRVTQNGPGTGQAWDGALRVFRGTTLLATDDVRTYAPPGWVQTLSVTVPVTAADLAAGDIRLGLVLETFHGTAKAWTADQFSASVELVGCDATSAVQFLRTLVVDCQTGEVLSTTDTDLEGAPYVVTGEVGQCTVSDPETCPCVSASAIGEAVADALADTGVEQLLLCDDNGPFVRVYQYGDNAGPPADFTLAGAPYAAVGTVEVCGAEAGARRDVEQQILCDANGTRFVRVYQYGDDTGTPSGAPADFTLAGAPFVPVGAVGVCTTPVVTDFDFAQQVLCDGNNTPFIRRFTFNSQTGAVTATVNLTLAGAAFAPVGTVGQCSDCCPQVIGNGCTNVGSGFYTAVRSTAGVISLIDSVTGAAVPAANVVPCPSDNTVRTLSAQGRLIADADAPWSPGADVVGTLTALTMTVLSGTATLTDQSGTVLAGLPAGFTATWSAEDDNTLLGPASIDAVGGSTVVHWTQR